MIHDSERTSVSLEEDDDGICNPNFDGNVAL